MKIEILGKFYDNHSLAIINRNLAIGLHKKNIKVCITPLDAYNPTNKVDIDELEVLDELAEVELDSVDIQIRHTYPPIWRWPFHKNTKVVFIQPWEFCKIPMEWEQKWETFADALIVPSTWTRERVLDAGLNPEKVFTIPNGYDPNIFNMKKESDDIVNSDKFIFTFVGSAQFRKGIDILLEVWANCFERADNVLLYVKDTPSIYGENNLLAEIIKLQYKTGCAEVIYDDNNYSTKEMANIYKRSNIIIHPFRGEGFGMHVQEAMACGAFPIVTAGGPMEDFINDQCGILLPSNQQYIDLTANHIFATKPGDSLTGMGGHSWVLNPDRNALINIIRSMYHQHERQKVLDLVKNAKLFTWDYVINTYIKTFEKLINEQIPERYS